ncbi:GNAT family N-acetyltransferase [Vibrio sp. SCSIO 43135]|uniref:GNAT family N-acetyltransferase n=1 Tax=Vibrio sp. SCSIO 43135 TaxID=2819096 RepID=UPI0020751AAA|nr:GNAT family N-acetyltransferase [Vibrio sp. SCSIO 43135]USD42633.1 GNAT family N-acetyltransferase [Vibrio sp. SCSIO 43135]
MISFQLTADLEVSAKLTFENMAPYYAHYGVDWECSKIHEQIVSLENWDVLYNGEVVGAIRLAYDGDDCWLRDLQVSGEYQNKGIGAATLSEIERLAHNKGSRRLWLRVFKISPARNLYLRSGFFMDREEERFHYMCKEL